MHTVGSRISSLAVGRLAVAAVLSLAAHAAAAQPAVKLFTDHPEYEDVKISPQGTYLAYTRQSDDSESLIVVRTADLSVVSTTSFGRDTDVQEFDWASEQRILLS